MRPLRTDAWRWVPWLVGLLTCSAAGCDSSEDIVADLVPLGPAVRVDVDGEGLGSVGLIDGWTLLSTDAPLPSDAGWERSSQGRLRWVDAEGRTSGSPRALGRLEGGRVAGSIAWTRHGDELIGQSLNELDEAASMPPYPRDWIVVHRARPPPDGSLESERVMLPVAIAERGWAQVYVGSFVYSEGFNMLLPSARSGAGVLLPIGSLEPACPPTQANRRLFGVHVVDGRTTAGRLSWEEGECDFIRSPVAFWAVALPDGQVGVLFRYDDGLDGNLRWTRVDATGRGTPPRDVGRVSPFASGAGAQPRAVSIGDRVLFTEREARWDECHILRLMNADGSDPRDAPWQMPCRSGVARVGEADTLQRINDLLELAPIGPLAVGAFVDQPNADHPDPGPPAAVRLVVLTGDGRRGSEVLAASGVGDRPGLVRVATEGDTVIVAWSDSAAGREGIWLRRFRLRSPP